MTYREPTRITARQISPIPVAGRHRGGKGDSAMSVRVLRYLCIAGAILAIGGFVTRGVPP